MDSNRQVPIQYLQEMLRSGAVELHATAAVVGGIASQEITKILTRQYIPITNTLVYDGVTGSGLKFKV